MGPLPLGPEGRKQRSWSVEGVHGAGGHSWKLAGEGVAHGASQVALVVENPPANAGDIRDAGSIPRSGRSPGQEDPLEEGRAAHSSILAWRIPRTEEPGGL